MCIADSVLLACVLHVFASHLHLTLRVAQQSIGSIAHGLKGDSVDFGADLWAAARCS